MKTHITALLGILILALTYCQGQSGTFRNPILDETVNFGSVFKHQGFYYLVRTKDHSIELLKSHTPTNFRNAQRQIIYNAPDKLRHREGMSSPRMHLVQGQLYIYFDCPEKEMQNRGLFVIQARDPCYPMGGWSSETRIFEEDVDAIKPTVFENKNDDLYLVWTRPAGNQSNFWIAIMETPMKAYGGRSFLRRASGNYATSQGKRINEGATILQRNGAVFLVFSASASNSKEYCLGIMGMDGENKNPLLRTNWWNDVSRCVFSKNDEEKVYGTGHASFVTSPDDSETWMVYQAWDNSGASAKTMRIQKLDWVEMNRPKFPTARGLNVQLQSPA